MPLKLFPPVFGIMLNSGPPRSTSPSPPEIVIWTLRRLTDRIAETRDATTVERRPDVHAIDLVRAFVAAAAARGEEVVRFAGADIEPVA